MAKDAKKYGDVVSFISEHAKDVTKPESNELKFAVNQADYTTFMSSKGVTKDMLKQVATAQSEYCNGTVESLTDILVKDKNAKQATISTRTPSGVLAIRQMRQFDTRKPATGEPITKFGVVSIKLQMKSHLDKDLIKDCMAAVEKAS
jgi:hypothetical protein